MAGVQTKEANLAEYRLFPPTPDTVTGVGVEKYLEEQLEIYLAHLSSYLVDHIWQNEPFRLGIVQETELAPGHLIGRTNYGDNVDDEWFIVFLLYQLTKDFPGLVARITDEDGEFLLIEAAEHLPKWVEPETAEQRVYIYGGKLHLIPVSHSPADIGRFPPGTPSLREAVNCVRQHSSHTRASDKIQRDISLRTNEFPEKKYKSIHRTNCYMPAPLAAVLDHCPTLIAPIVQAFYHRDPVDLKACVTFQKFRPGTRVTRQVRFTRCLYAQLMQQKFQPDRRSGYTLPATSNPQFRAHDLGMKLAHGAEILCSKCGPSQRQAKGDDLTKLSRHDRRWQHFVQALDDRGYFRGQLEGSQLYNKLLDDARNYFYTSAANPNRSDRGPGKQVLDLLQTVSYDIEEMRKEEKKLPSPDDDSWLEITPEQLDQMMAKAVGRNVASDSFDLSQMSDGLNSFIENVSSHEGAEFPKNDDSEIGFDSSGFIHTMQKMFEFDDEADGNTSSDMSEYGSDDDLADSLSPSSPQKSLPGAAKSTNSSNQNTSHDAMSPDEVGNYLDMKDYMEIMDRELAKTAVGQSFHKQSDSIKLANSDSPAPKPPPRKKKQHRQVTQPQTTATPSSQKPANKTPSKAATANGTASSSKKKAKKSAPKAKWDDIDDLDDDFQPVDVDMNLVKNMLDSYTAQQGTPGPASNMLGGMGVRVPKDNSSKK